MRLYQTEGIIYKINEYKDYDLIVSILSPEYGKIFATAHGARRPKSRKRSHLDILNFNAFNIHKGKQGFESISETKIIENFRPLRNKYPFYFFYLAELIDKISVDETDARKIYQLLLLSLTMADIEDFKKYIVVIEIKLLKILGLEPKLGGFLDTEIKFTIKDNFYINYEMPGYNSKGEKDYSVSATIIKCQRYMLEKSLKDQKMLQLDNEILEKISSINRIWILNSLGIKLKSLKFLNI